MSKQQILVPNLDKIMEEIMADTEETRDELVEKIHEKEPQRKICEEEVEVGKERKRKIGEQEEEE